MNLLSDILDRHAQRAPARAAVRFLARGDKSDSVWTYAEIDARARGLAALLADAGARQRPVLLVFPPGLEFVAAFLACLYAGAIAVPVPLLTPRRSAERIAAVARDARPHVVLSTRELTGSLAIRGAFPEDLRARWLPIDALNDAVAEAWKRPRLREDAIALLQYTSGSTAAPRGVVVTHANLLANLAMIRKAFAHGPETRMVSWLPLFHDMGLVGGLLQPLFVGGLSVLMSPLDFLQRPIRWLQAIDRYRGTTSGGPTFAYALCADRIPAEQVELLDLSSWTVAYCGAEPVRASALRRFARLVEPAGFSKRALFPCYGLAEATLFVSGGPVGSGVKNLAASSEDGEGSTRTRVSCGSIAEAQTIAIVDPETREPCPDGRVGEIWIAGPHVAAGYWRRAPESAATFGGKLSGADAAPFLRTGDLGMRVKNELVVTGRLKDVLIVRGAKHHPEDIEATASSCHATVSGGAAAVFAVETEEGDGIVVLQEVGRRHLSAPDLDRVAAAIQAEVCEIHGVRPLATQLLRPGSLPRTSSHKVQRAACRAAYLADALEFVSAPVRGKPVHRRARCSDEPSIGTREDHAAL